MPPRMPTPSRAIASILRCRPQRPYATAAATTPAASYEQMSRPSQSIARYPSTQPPSYKPPEFRKSQLLRQYASLLRSTPLMLIFQHNNLKANEWVGIRRELAIALRKVDEARIAQGLPAENLADAIKIQIIQTGIFGAALKIVEYYRPDAISTDPAAPQSTNPPELTHTLSESAHEAMADAKTKHALEPLLSGPLMVLTFPTVSPQHMKAALSIVAPSKPEFPPPTKRAVPGWHEPSLQAGLQKLILLGARVEGKVFDVDGTKWVGSIEGGLEGLRGQLVNMLQAIGAGVTNTLESAGKSLYFTVEGRRTMLEDEEKSISGAAAGEAPTEERKFRSDDAGRSLIQPSLLN